MMSEALPHLEPQSIEYSCILDHLTISSNESMITIRLNDQEVLVM